MTTLNLYGGILKRDIVQLAYEEIGQSDIQYTLEPDDYTIALRRLDSLMHEWKGTGINLGYNFSTYGNGSPDDESGIPFEATQVVAGYLALRIAPTIGKTLSAETKAALVSSLANLRAMYFVAPQMQFSRQTARGSGNRWSRGFRNPYYLSQTDPIVPGYPVEDD